MSACPTIKPDHVCDPEITMPACPVTVSVCDVGAAPEDPPIVGIETGGGTNVCYLVDGAIQSFVVEVIRDDTDELTDVTLIWHNLATGESIETAPDGPVVSCDPQCQSTCVDLGDGTFGAGSVSYVILPDGSTEVIAVTPEGASVADPADCC